MESLKFRQVHLDFHTSGVIENIGTSFNKKQFQEALTAGHINSITVFSKCHHGWSYHPTDVNEMHPGLNFDLLGAQLDACREIGVNAPVYISAGFDEKEAVRHPEWLSKGSPNSGADFVNAAYYHLLCYNTPYMDLLEAQVEEVMRRYNPVEIFLDISNVRVCYCSSCLKSMAERGLDPCKNEDALKMGEVVYAEYCRRIERVVRRYNADTMIFHNAGNIKRGRRDLAHLDTHLELESLPTGGWGYDHFPMSAAYVRTLGMEYLGMTGKFHTTWGEFGGFKHPNALRYETALSIAEGAKCSIGDQLHPSGEMNMSTYRLIGKAYNEIEQKEEWCKNVTAIRDIAVLSCEACAMNVLTRSNDSDTGASRILSEGNYLYDIIDLESTFAPYKLIILPDHIRLDAALAGRLHDYIADGGCVLASGESGLYVENDNFALDFGADFIGSDEFKPTYMIPSDSLAMTNGVTEYVMYENAYDIKITNGTMAAMLSQPYFNRSASHFSSHQHTPNKHGAIHDGAVLTSQTAYICWNVFDDYAHKGSLHLKELVINMIEKLIGDKITLRVKLPDRGIVTLMKQEEHSRIINHLLFAHTCVRGNGIEVIEDTVPLYDTEVKIKLDTQPKRVYLAPQKHDIAFDFSDGVLSYTVPKIDIHQMTVIDL